MLEMPCEFEGVAYEKLRDMQRARRERNLEHLREGVGLAQAARAVGVSKRAGKVWRNGRTRLYGRDEQALVDRYSGGVEKPKGVDCLYSIRTERNSHRKLSTPRTEN